MGKHLQLVMGCNGKTTGCATDLNFKNDLTLADVIFWILYCLKYAVGGSI